MLLRLIKKTEANAKPNTILSLKVSEDTTSSTRKLMGTSARKRYKICHFLLKEPVNEKDVIQPFIYYNKRLKYKASLVQIWELVTVELWLWPLVPFFMATSYLHINKNKNKNIIINFNSIKRFKSYSCDHREAVTFTTSLFLWLLVTCILIKIKIKIL